MELLICKEVRSLNVYLSVRLGSYLADHALDVVDIVLLDSAAIELVEVLTGSTHVDVEYVYLGIRIFFADKHSVLCGIHTAYLRAVGLALLVVASRAYALHENDSVRVALIGGTEKCSAVRTCGIHKSLKLERSYNVGALVICKFVVFIEIYRVEAGRNNDSAVLLLDDSILLLVVDSTCRADLRADAALACFEHHAVIRVDSCDLRDSLSERDIYCRAVIESHIELVGDLFHRALFCTESAARTLCLVNIASLFLYLDSEVSDKALDVLYLAERVDSYLLIL